MLEDLQCESIWSSFLPFLKLFTYWLLASKDFNPYNFMISKLLTQCNLWTLFILASSLPIDMRKTTMKHIRGTHKLIEKKIIVMKWKWRTTHVHIMRSIQKNIHWTYWFKNYAINLVMSCCILMINPMNIPVLNCNTIVALSNVKYLP